MEYINLGLVLLLGAGLGLLHALDSDHLLTLANFSPDRHAIASRLTFCSRWAIGHGAALLVFGSAVLIMKMAIPYGIAAAAEHIVGMILLVLGSLALYHTTRSVLLARHGQLLLADTSLQDSPSAWQQTRIVGIGFLHGTAGSATLLALLPLTQLASTWQGMGYLLAFSVGVLLAMLLFGMLFGTVLQTVARRSVQVLSILRMAIAVPAIGVGMWMVLATT